MSINAPIRLSLALALLWATSAEGTDLAAVEAAPAAVTPQPAVQLASDQVELGPKQTVSTLQTALLEAMQRADELGFQGRYDLIKPVVGETFDVAFMGSKSVGRHWKKLSADEQAAWLAQFSGYLAANYAGNFKGWDGESFVMDGEQPAPRDTRVVLTTLKVPGSEDVILNYRLHQAADGQWRIIDIYLKGTVSELALRRSDFSTTLKDKGFSELTSAMDKKIDDLREKGGG